MRTAFALAVVLTLAGCATPYTQNGMGFTGGVEAQMITDDTARISARGNAYTDQARIEDFVLLKSAQTALDHGFTYFAVVSSADASRTGAIATPGTMQTNVYGSTAFTTYSPGLVHSFREAWRGHLCSILQGELPGDAPGSTGSGQSRAEISTEVELGVFRHRAARSLDPPP